MLNIKKKKKIDDNDEKDLQKHIKHANTCNEHNACHVSQQKEHKSLKDSWERTHIWCKKESWYYNVISVNHLSNKQKIHNIQTWTCDNHKMLLKKQNCCEW